MTTKNKYQRAAEDLNDILGLEPEIDIKLKTNDLKAKIKEASQLIEPYDKFDNNTTIVLAEMGVIIKNLKKR